MSSGIAIVGLACRYPDAASPEELWENLLAGRRAFRRIPQERLSLPDYHSSDRGAADLIYSTQAAVLDGYEFDRLRFRVTGPSFRSADITHWLALEVAAEALEAAGFPAGDGLPRTRTGVIVGNTLTGELSRAHGLRLRWPYVRRVVAQALARQEWSDEALARFLAELEADFKGPFATMTEESLAGGLSNTIAGRIANHFDFKGGGFTVDGACASSLLAVCQCASALAAGDLDFALAGGVDVSLDPFELVGFARTGALSPDEMFVYDRRSRGFIPGEGCGFVALMREDDARAQGRRVYAVLRGWGFSSDGKGGLTRPEAEGHLIALRRAYRRAGFGPERVGYFEGHGTGTPVGDSTELEVLTRARRAAGPGLPPVAVGSIKANIGHTKAAAGVAALLKATLALYHQVLPPTIGCDDPAEALREPTSTGERPALKALARGELWPLDVPLVAGVSAMGFGGINSHLVLEGASPIRRLRLDAREARLLSSRQDHELFLLASSSREDLESQLSRLETLAPQLSLAELGDLAATLARSLRPGKFRAAVVARSPGELEERLAFLRRQSGEPPDRPPILDFKAGVFWAAAEAPPRIGLLFPGQGSPANLGGGAWARRFPEVEALYREAGVPAQGEGVETAIAQPAIVTASLAGLAVLRRVGLDAEVGIGHSLGELSALSWAGAFDGATLLRIARLRGEAMSRHGAALGAMAGLAADAASVETLLAELGRTVEVVLAGLNSPAQTVVSGRVDDVERTLAAARARGWTATRLRVSHAFHSPLVAEVGGALALALSGLELGSPERRVISTVTAGELDRETDVKRLAVEQLTSPVRFAEALMSVASDVDLWIEVGPGRVLTQLLADFGESGAERGQRPFAAESTDAGGDSLSGLLSALGAAFSLGAAIDAEALFEGRLTRPFDLHRERQFLVNPCELAPRLALARKLTGERAQEELRDHGSPAPVAAATAPDACPAPPLDVLRSLVATRSELPVEMVREDSRLLSDLHLNSITVGQLVAAAARQLGLAPPASPNDFSHATVGEVATALAEQQEIGATARPSGLPAGVDSWVRAFTVEWQLDSRPAQARRVAGSWQVFAPPDHPLASALTSALELAGGHGVALCLPVDPDLAAVPWMLQASRAALALSLAEPVGEARLLILQQGGGGGGLGRTFHRENPQIPTIVVDLPFEHPNASAWIAAEAGVDAGYREVRYDHQGTRLRPFLRLLAESSAAPGPEPLLGPGDVLLVTGGGKGITAECALALTRKTGARLALLGRSREDQDADLAANLERFRDAGARVVYCAADVSDALEVRRALTFVESELGPVTALLHGAGRNQPKLLPALDFADFEATLGPKVAGLEHLLAAIDPARLKLLVAFGSIIATIGMPGEADYAIANDWMAARVERFAATRPTCRCLVLDWSVWSGIGMGERLGRIEALLREGVSPISTEAGVNMLLELLDRPTPSRLVVCGRFGEVPTLQLEPRELPFYRFVEAPRVYYPGIELVVDATLSAGSDPYLADHELRGERLFPAVLGLEAMAQVASCLVEASRPPRFDHVELLRPVVVSEREKLTIRLAALKRAVNRVEVALRSERDGFSSDCFRATCHFEPDAPAGPRILETLNTNGRLDFSPHTELYPALLFQRGRFERLGGFRHIAAHHCVAEIQQDGAATWFSSYLPGRLLLGDPGARDAALHCLQVCVPHATILPIGAEHIESGCLRTDQAYSVAATERERRGDLFVYDVEILGQDGGLVERWTGLSLKAIEHKAAPETTNALLVGSYLERRLEELLPQRRVELRLAVRKGQIPGKTRADGDLLLTELLSGGDSTSPRLHRRPDGKPQVTNGRSVSLSHCGALSLAMSGTGPLGCDLDVVTARGLDDWRDLLGEERLSLVETLRLECGESFDSAATRVWTALEAVRKASSGFNTVLVLDLPRSFGSHEPVDSWKLLRAGSYSVASWVTRIDPELEPLAVALAVEA